MVTLTFELLTLKVKLVGFIVQCPDLHMVLLLI